MASVSALQQALLDGATPQSLRETLGMHVNQHPVWPELWLFCYHQIDSPKNNDVTRVARGHILNSADGWNHVCRPFDRFFNVGEMLEHAPQVDLDKAEFYEKLDGSLLNLWHYDGGWNISTRRRPDAFNATVSREGINFGKLFWRTFEEEGYRLADLDTRLTYTFELCAPENKVIVKHPEPRLYLINVRSNLTGEEGGNRFLDALPFRRPAKYEQSAGDIKASLLTANGMNFEGYVAVQMLPDGSIIRQKLKTRGYLALAHMNDSCTPKMLLQLAMTGEQDEFLAAFPEHRDAFIEQKGLLDGYIASAEAHYKEVKGITDQREFAQAIGKKSYSGYLFTARKEGISVRQAILRAKVERVYAALNQ